MVRKLSVLLLLVCFLVPGVVASESQVLKLDKQKASKFAAMALHCIEKEYPNKLSHVMNDEKEVLGPKALHPAFYGCFDWHSSVHGHWMLIRLLKLYPDIPRAADIRAALSRNITAENIKQEVAYLHQKSRKAFERTYGWSWLLKLVEELYNWDDKDGKKWLQNLKPLEMEMVKRYMEFLPKQTYAIRTGVHPNTAFGIAFALDYARTAKNKQLEELLIERSYYYYFKDKNCPSGWEPGGEDFFSPCLMEAWLMLRVMKPAEFQKWFHSFLPRFKDGKDLNLMEPAIVTDRTDGKLVHLDGVNLSRAWCMKQIANALPKTDKTRDVLLKAAHHHARSALANIHSGDYAGEHWLASFATYMLSY